MVCPFNKSAAPLVHAYRQYYKRNALVVQPSLQGKYYMVVKEPVDKGILFKDKLPAEEYRRWESLNNLRGDFHNLVNYVNAYFGNALGV